MAGGRRPHSEPGACPAYIVGPETLRKVTSGHGTADVLDKPAHVVKCASTAPTHVHQIDLLPVPGGAVNPDQLMQQNGTFPRDAGQTYEGDVKPSEPQASFERVFRSDSIQRDNFLARLFGIFSEHVVRTWCDCPQAPYLHIGRPTLRKPSESHRHTLDFTLQHRQSAQLYAAEMKCWTTWEDYRYLRLTEAGQLQRIIQPAFRTFLAFAREPTAYHVFVAGKPTDIDGAILVWGAATPQGRSAAAALGIADVLTVEDMVGDLHVWQPPAWRDFIAQRRSWATELFDYLD